MRFYSRQQLLLATAVTAVAALVVGAGLGAFVVAPRLSAQRAEEAVGIAAPSTVRPQPVEDALPVQLDRSGGELTSDEANNIQVYDKVNKSVVYITTITMEYSFFFEAMPQEGTGSGVIIDADGHVLTNYHVVKGATQLRVTLADGSEMEAKITGTDAENDLAVIKFDPKGRIVTPVAFGTSTNLRVGQKVLAIGNPFGLDRTLTTGIISALDRPLQTEENTVIRSAIQTDAAINPGNSGGPLLNSRGELIGINTAIYSTSGSSAGVGFAVPVNTARRVADELIRFGVVRRGWIDIEFVPLFPQLVNYFRLPVSKGILVSEAGPTARAAGIRGGDTSQAVRYGRSIIYAGGDIIVEVNGDKVDSYSAFLGSLEETKPGEVVTIKLLRGGQERSVTYKLVERPKQ